MIFTKLYRQGAEPLDRRKEVAGNGTRGRSLDHRGQSGSSLDPRRTRDRSRTSATRRNGQPHTSATSPGPHDDPQYRYSSSPASDHYGQPLTLGTPSQPPPSSLQQKQKQQQQHLDPKSAAHAHRKTATASVSINSDSGGLARNDSLSSDPSDCARVPSSPRHYPQNHAPHHPPHHASHHPPHHQPHYGHHPSHKKNHVSHVKKPCGPERRNHLRQHKSLSSSDEERYGTTPEYTSAEDPESESISEKG